MGPRRECVSSKTASTAASKCRIRVDRVNDRSFQGDAMTPRMVQRLPRHGGLAQHGQRPATTVHRFQQAMSIQCEMSKFALPVIASSP